MNKQVSRFILWMAAFALAATIVFVENLMTDLVLHQQPFADGSLGFIDAPDVAVLHLVLTGLPFCALALRANRRLVLWAAAVLLTSAFSAYAVWRVWEASLIDFAGGADIGLGLIMMAAPFVILIALKILSLLLPKASVE